MAASLTAVVNNAIAIMGKSLGTPFDYIEDITDTESPTAQWASRCLDQAIDAAIEILDPQECLRYADPGAIIVSPVNVFPDDYDYIFTKPPCLAMRSVIQSALDTDGKEVPVRYLEIGGEIGCVEEDDILFKYLVRNTITTTWSWSLSDVVIHMLAYALCGPFKIAPDSRSYVRQLMEVAIARARGRAQMSGYDNHAALAFRIEETW